VVHENEGENPQPRHHDRVIAVSSSSMLHLHPLSLCRVTTFAALTGRNAMNTKTKIGIGVAAGVLVLGGSSVALAAAMNNGDEITGPDADHARAVAAAAVPGGQAGKVDTDNDQSGAAYGVTVTKPDASAVEVHLDNAFHVLGIAPAGQDGDDD
jgi:hypothetical protein